jgi:D-3-phosphoglycerate dehydrogenase
VAHILVAGRIHSDGIDVLKAARDHTYDLVDEVSVASYVPLVGKADAIVIRTQPVTAEIVAGAPRLRIVSRHGVGYDAVDVAALNARKIALAIVGDVNSRAVAEHTLMLMLATARRTAEHDRATRDGNWGIRNRFETVELDGKSLLVVGFGRIGRGVARLAQAFGMKVTALDPLVKPEILTGLGVEAAADLGSALGRADYVSLHIPAAPGGPFIGAAELALMKPSAILINAARGGLVDEPALDRALRDGRLYGAGLDVFAAEPPPSDNPLLANPRVTLSPHSAGLTQECAARMAVAAVRNVLDYLAGRPDPALIVNAAAIGIGG